MSLRVEPPKKVIKVSTGWGEPDRWIALRFVSVLYVVKIDGRRIEDVRWKVVLKMNNEENECYQNIFDTEGAAVEALESYIVGMSA